MIVLDLFDTGQILTSMTLWRHQLPNCPVSWLMSRNDCHTSPCLVDRHIPQSGRQILVITFSRFVYVFVCYRTTTCLIDVVTSSAAVLFSLYWCVATPATSLTTEAELLTYWLVMSMSCLMSMQFIIRPNVCSVSDEHLTKNIIEEAR